MTTDSIEAADRLAADRLAGIRAAMGRAASLTGRTADDITLIAVSKTQAAEAIRPLIAAGQRVFGENRVQEAESKWPARRDEHDGKIGRAQVRNPVTNSQLACRLLLEK